MNTGRRNVFSEKEDEHLVKYIAQCKPVPYGRTGNNLYIALEENAGNQWPWSKTHSWQSWRERYKKNQSEFDEKIRRYQKKLMYEKRKSQTPVEAGAGESSSKTKKAVEQQSKAEDLFTKGTTKPCIRGAAQGVKEGTSRSEKTVPSKPIPQPSPMEVAGTQGEQDRPRDLEGAEDFPDDLDHELFGSFVEEEAEVDWPHPEQRPKSLPNIYSSVDESMVKTTDTVEPRLPGAIDVLPPILSQEPTPPKSSPEFEETPAKPPLPQLKKRKRKEEDPFETPSDTPPPVVRKTAATKQPPTIVEGSFRTTFKPKYSAGVTSPSDVPEWPPKRRKKANDAHVTSSRAEQPAVVRPIQPPQVNAIASSSKTKHPFTSTAYPEEDSRAIFDSTKDVVSSSTPRTHTEPLLKVGHDVLIRPTIGTKVMARRTASNTAIDHQGGPSAGMENPPQRGFSNSEGLRTVPQGSSIINVNAEIPLKNLSRIGSHNLPTRPTSDTDPFTAKGVSDKAAGKARADSSTVGSKAPRRIDFHRENLSRRLRTNASLSSRRSSALSSRTSTTSSTAKKTGRRSSSFRQSIAALELPDEEKREFALAAAEDIAEIIEKLAKDHGVSNEIALKTYMRTRSIDKTKFILGQFYQTLAKVEKDIYAQMPDLNHVSEDETDSDVPEGLVPKKSPEKEDSPAKDDSTRLRHSSGSRRSKRSSLNIKPFVVVDEPVSDYSPPNSSRAGQFARLVRQGRREEAIEREKRRASGQVFPQTQVGSPNKHLSPSRGITITPTPHQDVFVEVESTTDDDDMYMDYEQSQEADDESESGLSGGVRVESSPILVPRTLEQLVSEAQDRNPEAALEHRTLALNVTAENADTMRKFEARGDPDFLKLMSLQMVSEILGTNIWDQGQGDNDN